MPSKMPEVRDEVLSILRGLVDRVSIGRTDNGLGIELVGRDS